MRCEECGIIQTTAYVGGKTSGFPHGDIKVIQKPAKINTCRHCDMPSTGKKFLSREQGETLKKVIAI